MLAIDDATKGGRGDVTGHVIDRWTTGTDEVW
jgi:hypothetical protein